ncbi:diguanylate cyclase (GGDEF) domain-containing protein [Malonomonas rubra DSM 5091]|uniref:Diguanylate cyclase (GGDEF) domain-containing protein n=1 Tax=Malonomonas rubra DSM 5091 TaxID=1122189 RepID=A0A1M6GR82_MALRU|nr:response regulator [Malonomonas rubra]SHJ12376.1 diguanylate cyclase (GGDEF) domain-containing protein [Malonomonas rubra DSM 5091]
MPRGEKKRILLADADLLSAATTIGALKDDYHVVTAKSAADILKQLKKQQIDMLIMETKLPDMDGFELCRKLKSEPQTKALPVVFLTSVNKVAAEEQGFAAGAVEYIVKPFNAPTVKARIRNQLKLSDAIAELQRLNQLALDANPNTGLPGNTCIICELQRLVDGNNQSAAVIYADLDHFKVYNDTYGFAKGDDVINFTANVIRVTLQSHGCSEAFLGHIGGDDFVVILPAEKLAVVSDEIIRRIEQGIGEFYSEDDRAKGFVVATDREGKKRKHPLVSLSMGAIDLSKRNVLSAMEIADVCTETKKLAKQRAGSNIVVDKRRPR